MSYSDFHEQKTDRSRRRHPVIDLDLHVVERDELDVLDFAL